MAKNTQIRVSRPQKAVPAKRSSRAKTKAGRAVPRPVGPWRAAQSILSGVLPRDMVVFDVGAHYGNVTEMMMRAWPKGRYYCFDPDKESLEKLHARFDDDARVSIIPSALGSKQGTAAFHVCGQNTEMSGLLPRSEGSRRYYRHEVRDTRRVAVTAVDMYMNIAELDHIHFMKVDTQGGEKMVLKGAVAALSAGAIDLIYMEVLFVDIYKGASRFWELCRQLSRYDYQVFDIYNLQRSWINRQLKYGDALWVSPRIRASILDKYPEEWLAKSLPQRMCPGI